MEKVSWGSLLSDSYDILWKSIIRPPRSQYELSDLGPQKFRLASQVYSREDFYLKNDREMRLSCSLFRSFPKRHQNRCVIFLHGNCSSRVEAIDVLPVILPKNLMLCCLDLSGSGHSEGEFISLGHFEEKDLQVLIQHLRSLGVSHVGLWGRSMGAATSILRAAEDWSISAVVLDSPFSSLALVAQELVNSQIPIPEFLMNLALRRVRQEILERASFDIEELQPIRCAPRARSPALFATATDDDFILPHHTYDLHHAWGSEIRKLVTFEGGHNGVRPKWFLEEAAEFMASKLGQSFAAAPAQPQIPQMPQMPQMPRPEVKELQDPMLLPPPPPEEVKRRTQSDVALQLITMGFSQDIAEEAARHFQSPEDAVEWTLKQTTQIAKDSAEALDSSLAQKLRAPKPVQSFKAVAVLPEVEAAAAAAGRALRDLAIRDVEQGLLHQLLELGFAPGPAREAARRSSSVESAVAWLAETT